jgi:membrane-associated phospholipid phosphatase
MTSFEQGWALQVILWFQSWRTPLVEALALVFNYAGLEDVLLPVLAALYWCFDARFARRLTFLFAIDTWVNSAVKEVFHRPRPYDVSSAVTHPVTELSPGLPSGHAQNAVVMGGAVALRIRRRWVTVAAVAYMVLTALSRMALGMHFPQDVAAGLVIGLLVFGLYVWLEPPISAWLARRSLWTQVGLALAAGVTMLVVHPGLIPAASPDTLRYSTATTAVVIGAGIGFALETRLVRFIETGVWWKRLLRLMLGLLIVVAVRYALEAAFAALEPIWLFRVIRYAAVGLAMSLAAPWVFVTVRLAERKAT